MVAVIVAVLGAAFAPSAGRLDLLLVTVTVVGVGVLWRIDTEVVLPVPGAVFCSVSVTVQNPGVVEDVYVTVALPVASVATPTDLSEPPLSVPQVADGTKNVTVSLATAAPVTSVTVAVTVDVLDPLALMLDGLAVPLIVLGTCA
jgi:hypothetical protein